MDEEDGGDEDVAYGGMAETLVDPLTKGEFVNPVKSKVCGHTYSKGPIEQHIKSQSRGQQVKCPTSGDYAIALGQTSFQIYLTVPVWACHITGCGSSLKLTDLVPDVQVCVASLSLLIVFPHL